MASAGITDWYRDIFSGYVDQGELRFVVGCPACANHGSAAAEDRTGRMNYNTFLSLSFRNFGAERPAAVTVN